MFSETHFLFLNLPASDKITRRYMCSYQSPTSLFPPLELISLAAVYREQASKNPFVIDAVAQNHTTDFVINFIKENNIRYLITLLGFECFEEDVQVLAEIKQSHPELTVVVFGHYPTYFAEEILAKSAIDIVIKGEPELAFLDFITCEKLHFNKKQILESNASVFSENNKNRIKSYSELPIPAYDLIDHSPYHEPMMARPFGMIQTARGCPYSCNYCVKSFGTRLTLRSPEQVIEEIEVLIQIHHIKALRFIDDTFTINKARVINICKLMVDRNIKLEWSCLSRTDNLDYTMLQVMKEAGCKRIYFGVESGSQRLLDYYKKDVQVQDAMKTIQLTNKVGIETAGFFMLGLPKENENDFELTKQFIAKAQFDYIGVGGLILYPGTPLFEQYKNEVEFSLFPYINRFKDEQLQARYMLWNKALYDSFLKSTHFLKKTLLKSVQSPIQTIRTANDALQYQLKYRRGVFHHIQKHKKTLNYSSNKNS